MSLLSAPERPVSKTSTERNREQVASNLGSNVPTWLQRRCAALVVARLQRLQQGGLKLIDAEGERIFGDPRAKLQATVRVEHPRFYQRLALGGGLGAAEALFDADWSSDDLVAVVRLFSRNMDVANQLEKGIAAVRHQISRWGHWLRRNHEVNARKNIHAHYDLGNHFFKTFLDETMCYSSGVFPRPTATMYEASVTKMNRVCRKLQLTADDHLLEIGTGWGALAIYAAQHFGCRVTTTTISEEQYVLACERVAAAGVADRVQVLKQDYRTLTGSYDKLVSIEMIEAVGHQYFNTFFATCSRLLRPHGRMVLQAITIKEQAYREYVQSIDFIRQYIFPGGCLPSVTEMLAATTRATDLRPSHLEELTPHYVVTLQRWRRAFWEQIDQIRAQGFDERFIRLWDYYFAYCEAGFAERQVGCVQLVLSKPGDAIEPASWELGSAEIATA